MRRGLKEAWVVDADLKDFFGSVDHEKLLELVNQRVSDGRVPGLLGQMLTAGVVADGKTLPTEKGTPQGGIVRLPPIPIGRAARYRTRRASGRARGLRRRNRGSQRSCSKQIDCVVR